MSWRALLDPYCYNRAVERMMGCRSTVMRDVIRTSSYRILHNLCRVCLLYSPPSCGSGIKEAKESEMSVEVEFSIYESRSTVSLRNSREIAPSDPASSDD